ncbi:alpha-1,2-mannosyltransferase [Gordonia malaquae]|uniref:Putative glycosyltransferase n=1 Tax=Gordonia malaquae NBRC 108250 TaxID=1223542 RepID=M3TH98_GORML|nr:glycosyltransferase 87 family protein [Gordonia malaquae]GAC80836.1 putative glycosyltransferase [Gordonia malaquae NBRC 108250]SEB67716.1 alpha-1,2-mannosyltransferase [Gordonia malaquae]
MKRTSAPADSDVAGLAKLGFLAVCIVVLAMQVPVLVDARWSLFDTRIYLDGGHAVFHDPAALYTTRWQGGWWFTYPPFAAMAFAVLDLGPSDVATGLLAAASVAAMARIAFLVSRGIVDGLRMPWLDSQPLAVRRSAAFGLAAVVLLASALSEPVRGTIAFGQINLLIAWLTAEDFLGVGRARGKNSWLAGTLTGIAAGIKITPMLLVIPMLLAGRWRAARNAVLAFAATLALSTLVLPNQTWSYFTTLLWDPTRPGDPWYAWNQSIVGLAHRLTGPDGSPAAQAILMALVVAAGIVATSMMLRSGDRVGALLTGWLTIYLLSPITWYHHLVLVPALLVWGILASHRWPALWRTVIRAEVLLVACSVIPGLYKLAPSGGGSEFDYTLWQSARVESFPVLGLILLVTLALATIANPEPARSRETETAPPTPPIYTEPPPAPYIPAHDTATNRRT